MDKLIVIGNLGRDPEMRYMPNGKPVTNFSVASNRKWTDNEGVLHEETIWIRVSAFGRLAEVCNQYLSKGRQVYVEGRLRPDPETGGPRIYQRNDGSSGASYEIVAATVQFLGGRNDNSHLCSLAAPGKWQLVYEPGKWKRGCAGSKLFAVSNADLACQYGKIERDHFRPVEVWEALAKEVEELRRFLTMDRSRWEAFWSGVNTGLLHNPPAGTILVGQIQLVREVWPED